MNQFHFILFTCCTFCLMEISLASCFGDARIREASPVQFPNNKQCLIKNELGFKTKFFEKLLLKGDLNQITEAIATIETYRHKPRMSQYFKFVFVRNDDKIFQLLYKYMKNNFWFDTYTYHSDQKDRMPRYRSPDRIIIEDLIRCNNLSLEKKIDIIEILKDYVDLSAIHYSGQRHGGYLHFALTLKDFEMASFLLKYCRSNTFGTCNNGWAPFKRMPLSYAIKERNLDFFDLVLEQPETSSKVIVFAFKELVIEQIKNNDFNLRYMKNKLRKRYLEIPHPQSRPTLDHFLLGNGGYDFSIN